MKNIIVPESIQSLADQVDCGITNVQALLSAADDKVRFYLLNKRMFGEHADLIRHHALELQSLLSIAEVYLLDMERAQDSVTDALYGIQKEANQHE